ncbi:serine hydrolase [Citricoccus muralis]|uniref:Beta-lactamase family protein n=1 Tax=Citricoccus muralis TaxID=169134 RepID=A0A3D9LE92_9MICC|nr:serine hydrolase [Citricoccus muralis]REE04180.1 beta-lactamase family protein [Citricoccus muralis]
MSWLPAVRALPLGDIPAAYPQLRFAVRFADGRYLEHDAGPPHPLAGTGKLWLACVVDAVAGRDPGLPGTTLTVTDRHRHAARTGTLRLMSGDLRLSVEDAMGLILGTGDGACVLALLELLAARGVVVLAEARAVAADLGRGATVFTGVESDGGAGSSNAVSWGEGMLGQTNPADLCALLSGPVARSERMLGWMRRTVEPAGLAGGLPGFGPRTVPHQTIAGGELLPTAGAGGADGEAGAPGCASVLVLPAGVVAAYHPSPQDGRRASGLEFSAALGTLGLAVWRRNTELTAG